MPYIVTTKQRGIVHGGDGQEGPFEAVLSRRAVATLEGTLRCLDWTRAHGVLARDHLSSAGGTFTLPDGTVIEVEQTTWADLAFAAGLNYPAEIGARADDGNAKCQTEILDAYNAAQRAVA